MQLGFIQVAFAGHNRSEDLGDPLVVDRGLRAAFALLHEVGVRRASLLTGLAPGADLLAARAWREFGLGTVHAVFPYLDATAPVCTHELMDGGTWLDGAAAEAVGRNPHLDQTRWLIGAADLLVVVWTGDQARGAGGTADAVRLALEHGVPVLWVQTESGALRLIRPEHLDEDFGFLEFLEQLKAQRGPLVCDAEPELLQAALLEVSSSEEACPPDLPSCDVPPAAEPAPRRPLPLAWRAYAGFRRALGGTLPYEPPPPPPPELAAQPGFLALSRAHAAADATASRLGAVHRSQQLILLAIAISAAALGSAPALWPVVKLGCVLAELALALVALVLWRDSERGRRHERWGEARRLAEDLRLERVAWAVGVSGVRSEAHRKAASPALELRRRAGLPEGRFDLDRVREWGAWAVAELITGQAAYHRDQAVINGRVTHRVHEFENLSFLVLMVVLVGYAAGEVGMSVVGGELPRWVAGVVFMAGAIVPAIGAASLALEATLSLREQGQRSEVLAARLEEIRSRLGPEPSLQSLQSAIRSAIRLMRAQEEHWIEGAMRRRLYRAG